MRSQIPRISTRGYYDLLTGKTNKTSKYYLYPPSSFKKLYGKKEICIMIHGLRNNKAGAVNKFEIAKKRLKKINYSHPVIGYSYDSNTKGAHIKKTQMRALYTGQKIACKNGKNLAQFLVDFKKKSPKTRFRLLGHSLGSQVILSCIMYLAKSTKNKNIIESIHFFGASIPANIPSSKKYGHKLQSIVTKKIINYYAPSDDILCELAQNTKPLGLCGSVGKTISKYTQKLTKPKNHRFKSYAATLRSFP